MICSPGLHESTLGPEIYELKVTLHPTSKYTIMDQGQCNYDKNYKTEGVEYKIYSNYHFIEI